MRSSTAALVSTAIALLLTALVTFRAAKSPAVVVEDAPLQEFSATRALRHLEAIAREPHPTGTSAIDSVRSYILAEIKELGLTPETQTTVVARPWLFGSSAGRITNLVARVDGDREGRAIAIVAHYDSMRGSAGAGDDGAAVAAMLETMRALSTTRPLRNDVIFLFTDGEELGLLGIDAFLGQHPWARELAVVLNFEGRGTGGPVLMYETSPGNGRLIQHFRRGASNPVGSSLGEAVAGTLSGESDFDVLSDYGIPGLNFVFIHGATAYHTAQDSIARLDFRSVQHEGEYMLGLAREFGDADLDIDWSTSSNTVYFNLADFFVTYPAWLALPMAFISLGGVVAILLYGLRTAQLSVAGLIISSIFQLVATAFIGVVLFLASSVLDLSGYDFLLAGAWTSRSAIYLGLALVAVALTVVAWTFARRFLKSEDLAAAGLAVWGLMTLAVTIIEPGGSYLFVFPLLAALITAWLWFRRVDKQRASLRLTVALLFGAAIPGLIWSPTLATVSVAVGGQLSAGLIGASSFLLISGLMAPLLADLNLKRGAWGGPAILIIFGVLWIGGARMLADYDRDNRRVNSVLYVLDADQHEAAWYSFDDAVDSWTSQFLGDAPERTRMPTFIGPVDGLRSPAPVGSYAGANVTLVSDSENAGTRELSVSIGWSFPVHRALISVGPQTALVSVTIDDPEAGELPVRASFNYAAPEGSGFSVRVRCSADEAIEIRTVAQIYTLPDLDDFEFAARPADTMPALVFNQGYDSTYVQSVTTIGPASP